MIHASVPELSKLLRLLPRGKICGVNIRRNLLFLLPLLLSLIAAGGCEKNTEHKNVCPIDGQAPEWSKQIDAQTCEYFHFSPIERRAHSWTAPCEQSESH